MDYPVCKELIDSLHEQGYHVVPRTEWYQTQAQLAGLDELSNAARILTFRYARDGIIAKSSHDHVERLKKALEAMGK